MSTKSIVSLRGALLGALVLCSVLPGWSQSALPEGPGKQIVQAMCGACHGLRTVTNSGYSRADWDNTLHMMVNVGAPVPPDKFGEVVNYLAKNFPEKPQPPAVVIPGKVRVSIQEWTVPTPGSRPHDPMIAPDGYAWYSGQMANVLGRFDPRTQTFKEFHLTTPMSGPHGLTPDQQGNIWFTANFKGYVGKLDPATGKVTEYPLPDKNARDPHTPLFDHNGILWFTVQIGDMIGRLDPKTGEVKLVKVPTPKGRPYGMVINSQGIPYFVEFGSNKIGKIDPRTLEITEYTLPHPESRPRRVAITPDDVLWYSDYARGYLGRFDPKTGKITEWPSPGGRNSRPYGIVAIGDVLWYSESNVKPNTLVRFDSATQKFQSWIIPSGGGVVRNMVATKDGNLWLACSGVNGIAFVKVGRGSEVSQKD
jgi:virginiamycin B lyase